MVNNQIYFNIKDNQVKLSYRHAMPLTEFLTVIQTGILSALQGTLANVPEEQKQQVQEELYDMYNAAASSTLNYFAPGIELREHLTAQAILDAENNILDKELKKKMKDPTYISPYTR